MLLEATVATALTYRLGVILAYKPVAPAYTERSPRVL